MNSKKIENDLKFQKTLNSNFSMNSYSTFEEEINNSPLFQENENNEKKM